MAMAQEFERLKSFFSCKDKAEAIRSTGMTGRKPINRKLTESTGGDGCAVVRHLAGMDEQPQSVFVELVTKNEAETRYELIDPVLRDKGYRIPYVRLETPAPV